MSGRPNLKKALLEAQSMGLEVRAVRRTGEVSVWDPFTREKSTVNARRKDTPMGLMLLLKHSREARKGDPDSRSYLALPDGKVYWSCGERNPIRPDYPACVRKEGHTGPHQNQWGGLWPQKRAGKKT